MHKVEVDFALVIFNTRNQANRAEMLHIDAHPLADAQTVEHMLAFELCDISFQIPQAYAAFVLNRIILVWKSEVKSLQCSSKTSEFLKGSPGFFEDILNFYE